MEPVEKVERQRDRDQARQHRKRDFHGPPSNVD
jgi:hypothetical protein